MIQKEEIVTELYEILNHLNSAPWSVVTNLAAAKEKVKGLIKELT